MSKIYLVGALKNAQIPLIANQLRQDGHEVFDDWFSAGEFADTCWRDHELCRGRAYREALDGHHAWDVFSFDVGLINMADIVILILPAGRSAHMELGYAAGIDKETHILLDQEYDRWDVMYRFADGIWDNLDDLREELNP